MKEEILHRWYDALLEGGFIQRTNYLCCNDMHCANGILCELAVMDGELTKQDNEPASFCVGQDPFGRVGTLPVTSHSFNEWLGLSQEQTRTLGGNLIVLNDRKGLSYKQIAAQLKFYSEQLTNERYELC